MKKLFIIIILTLAGTLMVAYNSLGQENKWTLEECVLYHSISDRSSPSPSPRGTSGHLRST